MCTSAAYPGDEVWACVLALLAATVVAAAVVVADAVQPLVKVVAAVAVGDGDMRHSAHRAASNWQCCDDCWLPPPPLLLLQPIGRSWCWPSYPEPTRFSGVHHYYCYCYYCDCCYYLQQRRRRQHAHCSAQRRSDDGTKAVASVDPEMPDQQRRRRVEIAAVQQSVLAPCDATQLQS